MAQFRVAVGLDIYMALPILRSDGSQLYIHPILEQELVVHIGKLNID